MTGKNKTPLIGWHSADPTLKPWIEAEAKQRGVTVREFLDEVLSEYRKESDVKPCPDCAPLLAYSHCDGCPRDRSTHTHDTTGE